jgi:glycosyltransferase involved in cell wall biosynthesis
MTEACRVGAVLIGRNEGARLLRCLASVTGKAVRVVYVDSGSTDGSVAAAAAAGAEVVVLDMAQPFTAARARNAGIERLRTGPQLDYIQFVDGDCELQPNWIDTALAFLNSHARRRGCGPPS